VRSVIDSLIPSGSVTSALSSSVHSIRHESALESNSLASCRQGCQDSLPRSAQKIARDASRVSNSECTFNFGDQEKFHALSLSRRLSEFTEAFPIPIECSTQAWHLTL
jgi:hypothetical protein